MKASPKDVVGAVLVLAEYCGVRSGYESVVTVLKLALPELIRKISYSLFVHGFDRTTCSETELKAYDLIREYAVELNKKGSVVFCENEQ